MQFICYAKDITSFLHNLIVNISVMTENIQTKFVQDLKLSEKIITDLNLGYEMLGYIGSISIIKPKYNGRLFLKIKLYGTSTCDTELIEINSKSSTIWNYCKVFFNNNQEFKWIDLNSNIISSQGLGPEFDEYPLVINFGKFLKDKKVLTKFNSTDRYYLVYNWYAENNTDIIQSDNYSMIWPSLAENYVSTDINQQKQIIHLYNDQTVAELFSIEVDQIFYFNCQSDCCVYIEDVIQPTTVFLFSNYTESKSIKIKFVVGEQNTIINFYEDLKHSGASLIQSILNSDYEFKSNHTYLIELTCGCLRILVESEDMAWISSK